MSEILARTEEYLCPIKHAHKILGMHKRYNRFLAYGDAVDYEAKLEEYRVVLEPHMLLPSYKVKQHWHERYYQDAGNVWLCKTTASLFSGDFSTVI